MLNEIMVAIDVGSRVHTVGVGLGNGQVVEEFEISHNRAGFDEFFRRVEAILAWQPNAIFAREAEWAGPMIVSDARRVLELIDQVETLDHEIARIAQDSTMAGHIDSIPGFGPTCSAELAGEIGALERFRSESSLALYLGMAVLDDSSGTIEGSDRPDT